MPQFELENVGDACFCGLVRGRTMEDAIRQAVESAGDLELSVAPDADLHGWHEVYVDGNSAGRIRKHQRMRFRRD